VPADGTERVYERFGTWFQDYDALLSPTTAQPSAPADGWDHRNLATTLLMATNQVPFTQAWNVLNLPAASVPAGLTRDGFPIGVQLVAPRGGEALLLSLARQLEEIRPWPRHAPIAEVGGEQSHEAVRDAGLRRWFAGSRR
jgi:amidase